VLSAVVAWLGDFLTAVFGRCMMFDFPRNDKVNGNLLQCTSSAGN
jgi:hypothetical protein